MKIKDSVVFITGGASGLGAEVAKAIVKKEGKVIIADMNEKDGDLLVKQLGKQAFFTKCDVTCTEENQAAIQSGMQKFGKIFCICRVKAKLYGSRARRGFTFCARWVKLFL